MPQAVDLNTAAVTATSLTKPANDGFIKKENLAQYGGSDYTNAVRVERGISLEQAKEIAKNDPNIDYFVYLKGQTMVLPLPTDKPFDPATDPLHLVSYSKFTYDSGARGEGYVRVFHHGDVVFFKKEGAWMGSAPRLADAYYKESN